MGRGIDECLAYVFIVEFGVFLFMDSQLNAILP